MFCTWHRQKRSNSARLPHFSKLTTSKTKDFLIFELDNIQNEAILRDFLQKWRVDCSVLASCQCVLQFFHSTCRKYCACHEKVMPGHTKCCTCHAKSSEQTWRSDVSCTAPSTETASLQILFKCPTPAIVFGNTTKPSRFAHFWEGAPCLAPATRSDIWTSKSGAYVTYGCFVHFDFEMCFAPQRRALFRHLNFQKWSGHDVLCTFWLRNVLRATTVRTFSTSHYPNLVCFVTFWLGNVLRATTACNFSSLIWPAGSARAAVASLLFDPPEPRIIGKTQCFATFLPFRASASSFFWLFLFYSSLLSDSSHLCFSSVHIVGSLTSNLPSTIWWGLHVIDIDTIWLAFWNDGPLIPAWWCENMLCQG